MGGAASYNLVHFIFLWKLLSEAIIWLSCQLRSVHLITMIYGACGHWSFPPQPPIAPRTTRNARLSKKGWSVCAQLSVLWQSNSGWGNAQPWGIIDFQLFPKLVLLWCYFPRGPVSLKGRFWICVAVVFQCYILGLYYKAAVGSVECNWVVVKKLVEPKLSILHLGAEWRWAGLRPLYIIPPRLTQISHRRKIFLEHLVFTIDFSWLGSFSLPGLSSYRNRVTISSQKEWYTSQPLLFGFWRNKLSWAR